MAKQSTPKDLKAALQKARAAVDMWEQVFNASHPLAEALISRYALEEPSLQKAKDWLETYALQQESMASDEMERRHMNTIKLIATLTEKHPRELYHYTDELISKGNQFVAKAALFALKGDLCNYLEAERLGREISGLHDRIQPLDIICVFKSDNQVQMIVSPPKSN